jgi:hypothetical protein
MASRIGVLDLFLLSAIFVPIELLSGAWISRSSDQSGAPSG